MPELPVPRDVRMRGFATRSTVEAAQAWIDGHTSRLPAEVVNLWQAAGRVLAEDIRSSVNVPAFARSMMDGYAVRGQDTQGATSYNPLVLSIIGQALPAVAFNQDLGPQQAVRIMTGAPLPQGANAVIPAERVEAAGDQLRLFDEVPPGKNVAQVGEDVTAGDVVLRTGRVLRPQDGGLLSSLGAQEVRLIRRPKVRILITGNELLPAGSRPRPGLTPDANGPMLAALVSRDGGDVDGIEELPATLHGAKAAASTKPEEATTYLVNDDPAAILAALQSPADLYVVAGGSSVGQEDFAPQVLAQHGELAIHGIAMRPSSPTGMGLFGGKIVFLLPGNPVSCLCAYDFFAGRAIRLLGGRSADWPYPRVTLQLARKLVSQVGRVDYARVRIVDGQVEPVAISGASILSSTTIADGFVIISADSEGQPAGAFVEVFLYDFASTCMPDVQRS